MAVALLGLGSNLGDRQATLNAAVARLRDLPQTRVQCVSGWHETSPVGGPVGQAPFLNGAALLETALAPHVLFDQLRHIEAALRRMRGERWSARTLDLDLLLFDDLILVSADLVIPHPRMAFRRFVLNPAAEIAPHLRHPQIGWTIAELLRHLDEAPRYIALTGPIGVGKTRLAELVQERTGCRLVREPFDEDLLGRFYAAPHQWAWQTELELLQQRARLLSQKSWPADQWTLSDFWFDQSLAFASVWLAASDLQRFSNEYQAAKAQVIQPVLIVAIDADATALASAIADRGRPYEQALAKEQLQALQAALAQQIARPGIGPVLKLSNTDRAQACDEITAAMAAMQA